MPKMFILLLLILAGTCSCKAQQIAWLNLPDFPGGPRFAPVSFSINGKGYMGMGLDSNDTFRNDWYEYDAVANTWLQKTSLPAAGREDCFSFSIDSFGYVIAGASSSYLKEVWQYNPSNDTWTRKTDFPGTQRQGLRGFTIGNNAYMGGGFVNSPTAFDDFYEYNTATNTWMQKMNIPGGIRNHAAAFSVANKGYMGNGNSTDGLQYYKDFYEYNPANNGWIRKTDYPFGLQGISTYQSAVAGYILCGVFYQSAGIKHNPTNLLYKYTPVTDTWNLEGSFPGLPRGFAGSFSIAHTIYMGAGSQTATIEPILPGHTPLLKDFWKLAQLIDSIATSVDNGNGGEQAKKMVKIFPNPSSDYLDIDVAALPSLSHIRIYNVEGKLTKELEVTNSKEHLDISKLSSGTYYVELVTKNREVISSRFIKE